MDIGKSVDEGFLPFGNKQIKVVVDSDDRIWFSFSDTLRVLGIRDYTTARVNTLLEQHIRPLYTISSPKIIGQPKTRYVSEPGLYIMMSTSSKPLARQFVNWLFNEVVPEIRRYGKYQLKEEYQAEVARLLGEIDQLVAQNAVMQNDLRKNKYPSGGLLYVIEEEPGEYRIGMTFDMQKRKYIYDTHSLHKKNVVFMMEHNCPRRLEKCVVLGLEPHRYRDNKDYFIRPLQTIVAVINECATLLKTCDQLGGSNILSYNPIECTIIDKREYAFFLQDIVNRIDMHTNNQPPNICVYY